MKNSVIEDDVVRAKVQITLDTIATCRAFYKSMYREELKNKNPNCGQYSRIAAAYEYCHDLVAEACGLDTKFLDVDDE